MRDVLVIGIGTSGLTAALRCQEAGLSVTLLAKGVGSTHLAPGTIDVLGYDPELVESPSQRLAPFVEGNPDHPYAHLGAEAVRRSLEWFTARFDGYRYRGSMDENLLLPTAIGSIKPSALVPESLSAGDVRNGGRFLFVGLRQLKDFYPALAAQNVANAKTPSGADISARAVQIEPPDDERDVSSLAFARRFDEPQFLDAVATQISAHLEAGETVGLPAVLGVQRPSEVWSRLQDALGSPVFEIPSLPPSVPGMRLYEILRAQFEAGGGRVVVGAEAVGADTDGNRVTAVRVSAASRVKLYPARHFVLATGGFGSGAIEMDATWRVREKVFDLPVAGVPPDGEERFTQGYFDRHPLSRAGIRIDDSLCPLDESGNPIYENLSVVGACIAGAEAWREKSGEGISLSSGYKAATLIVEEQT
jgi:glycerol-3-phosphate dehydrogenase subunit B